MKVTRIVYICLVSFAVFSTVSGKPSVRTSEICQDPMPVSNFNYTTFFGRWFEIGKIQTPGGAAFQKGCQCTTADHSKSSKPDAEPSNVDTVFGCRKWWPKGLLVKTKVALTNMNPPGNYTETYFPNIPLISFDQKFTVLKRGFDSQNNEYTVTYDCSGQEYCIHFMGRQPTIDDTTLEMLINEVIKMGLNPLNIGFERVKQARCW
ncbi:apolipoprotein D-like [Amphiura filiformis]|uniref:apolipoprotein D-like n=1 Tax=Amphiura filiformis TaxID=82378 RepID=UPI003B211F98